MSARDMPIRRKLMTMILVASVVVMFLMSAAFVTYEFLTIRRTIVRQVKTPGVITAAKSTAALAFENQDDARDILAVLSAEKRHRRRGALRQERLHLLALSSASPRRGFPGGARARGLRV